MVCKQTVIIVYEAIVVCMFSFKEKHTEFKTFLPVCLYGTLRRDSS